MFDTLAQGLRRARAHLKPRRLVKVLAGLVLIELLALPLFGCDPFNTGFEDAEEAVLYESTRLTRVPEPIGQIVVMNWNAKFGGGRIDFWFDCYGDRVIMGRGEVIENLEGLAKKINQVKPDILLVQEIDTNSKRAAYIDQVQWLLDHTELNYGAYASQWKADFIPTDGIGRMDSGNAIFSRWPISEGQRIALPLSEEQDALTRYFYLKRNILSVATEVPGFGPVQVINVHTDAYGKDGTKRKHIDAFKAELDRVAATGRLLVAGGDLNTVPDGTTKLNGFDDSICTDEDFVADDYAPEAGWLTPLYNDYASAITLEDYQADNERYYSHTVNKDGYWNRMLDYLFTNGEFVKGSGMVHQDESKGGMATMPLSDHAPLTVILKLEAP
ncbi:MAG: endonuclease/exonuclease/phosphatase family protein [Bradymonadaceae bacterium]|nr:endonuclease/exonuclease/phosphatase family protein [Lujinxingiaceae bacterium]